MTKFRVVIPARLASTRLPGKPLADIAGKPMVVHVCAAAQASGAAAVLVAADDESICAAVRQHGFEALLTSADHASGTDRIAEAAKRLGWPHDAIVVNVQGDEPLVDPALIAAVAAAVDADAGVGMATAGHRIDVIDDLLSPHVVKVSCDKFGRALSFSRAPTPWRRDGCSSADALATDYAPRRHVGLYAFRVGFLLQFASLEPAPPERWEALEQLRALWHGFPVRVIDCATAPAPGVDTPQDLERVRAIVAARQSQELSGDR